MRAKQYSSSSIPKTRIFITSKTAKAGINANHRIPR